MRLELFRNRPDVSVHGSSLRQPGLPVLRAHPFDPFQGLSMNDALEAHVEPVQRSPNSRRNALIVFLILVVIAGLAWFMTRGSGDTEGSAGAGGTRGRG